ncbi:NAD(P)/FAD-dependent oxidoreductase [Nocardia sp. NPDC050697]|uniref:phytoene desaturase family protein n=1 Tax=Nocardia sp. NPDC050697 TaxID=3155158 RepID=UPI0033F9D7D2
MRPEHGNYDAVVVGGGHNGLVAAAYLARAGRRVAVLERSGHTGGAAVSARTFPGVGARLSRYSYLVSLLPARIVADLGLSLRTARRRISSYTPVGDTGLLVDTGDRARTAASFRRITGADREHRAWAEFGARTGALARAVFPTLTEPLPTRAELRARIGDDELWAAVFEEPLGALIERTFTDDVVRGVVFTDALIGTLTHAHDPSLRQNRCFLYHVIGGGTGDWDVPIGGMGALTAELAAAAARAGAEIVTGCAVTGIETGGVAYTDTATGAAGELAAGHILVNAAPYELDRLLGRAPGPKPEGAQLKINMVLDRLPRLRDPEITPREAFSGTFHIAETYSQLADAYRAAAAGVLPAALPSEIYCHTVTDPSILDRHSAERGMHTLTLFGLHTPARLFEADPESARERAVAAALARLDAVLAEPIAGCLARDAAGNPCLEAKSPLDLEREVGLPGGHIFHGDLAFPYREDAADPDPATRWGVATGRDGVLCCGAGALRGGGVSGIGGHNAAMAVFEDTKTQ